MSSISTKSLQDAYNVCFLGNDVYLPSQSMFSKKPVKLLCSDARNVIFAEAMKFHKANPAVLPVVIGTALLATLGMVFLKAIHPKKQISDGNPFDKSLFTSKLLEDEEEDLVDGTQDLQQNRSQKQPLGSQNMRKGSVEQVEIQAEDQSVSDFEEEELENRNRLSGSIQQPLVKVEEGDSIFVRPGNFTASKGLYLEEKPKRWFFGNDPSQGLQFTAGSQDAWIVFNRDTSSLIDVPLQQQDSLFVRNGSLAIARDGGIKASTEGQQDAYCLCQNTSNKVQRVFLAAPIGKSLKEIVLNNSGESIIVDHSSLVAYKGDLNIELFQAPTCLTDLGRVSKISGEGSVFVSTTK